MSDRVVICECFARDGLQHEQNFVPTRSKIAAIDSFTAAGFSRIEATSYAHPDLIPAFVDADAVLAGISRGDGVAYKATVPNGKALDRAIAALEAGHGATEISLLVSASESHSRRNLRRTRTEQWAIVEAAAALAGDRFRIVGVVSAAFGCSFEGAVDPGTVLADVARYRDAGVRLVTLGDTTGLATPATVAAIFRRVADEVPDVVPIAHFHDTRGTGLTNCVAALEAGCRFFDSAFGGVGGHPDRIRYGAGETGNVATEDLVNLLEALGVSTGLDLDRVAAASRLCEEILGRTLMSRVARAGFGLIPDRSRQTAGVMVDG